MKLKCQNFFFCKTQTLSYLLQKVNYLEYFYFQLIRLYYIYIYI